MLGWSGNWGRAFALPAEIMFGSINTLMASFSSRQSKLLFRPLQVLGTDLAHIHTFRHSHIQKLKIKKSLKKKILSVSDRVGVLQTACCSQSALLQGRGGRALEQSVMEMVFES